MRNKKAYGYLFVGLVSILLMGVLTHCKGDKTAKGDIAYYTCPMHPQIKMDQPGQCPICGMDLVPVKKSAVPPEQSTTSSQKLDHRHDNADDAPGYYTCPMHPQIKMDQPGQCPICGMDLVPGKKEANPSPQDQSTAPAVDIDPAYVQRIGVKTETVTKRELSRTVHASGKVAHDPELWIAQNEYLQALKLGDESLLQASKLKLSFMGLSAEEIKGLETAKQATSSFHLPSHNPEYVEAYIYPTEADQVKAGQSVEIYDANGKPLVTGTVSSIASILDMETRTLRVLIKIPKGIQLRPNTFIQAAIQVPAGNALAVPSSAILFNGDRTLVYVVTADGRYSPRTVTLGNDAGDYYEIKDGLQEGEKVVTNGHFLIDSETQIRLGSH